MPFTVSHTALVLPLKKLRPRWFSLTGLMAGAMAPDLQYFLLADTSERGLSHSWLGLFTVCLPLGLIFCFGFHSLFKKRFIEHLPQPLDRHLSGLAESRFAPSGWHEWSVLIVSILVGAISHFFWDSFTHPEGALAQHIPWLLQNTTIFGVARSNARLLQHVSTTLGGVGMVLGLWFWKLLPPPVDVEYRSRGQKAAFWISGTLCGMAWSMIAVWFYNLLFGWEIEAGFSIGLALQTAALASWAGFVYFVGVDTLISRLTLNRRRNG